MKKFWKRAKAYIADNWLVGIVSLLLTAGIVFALTHDLGSLVGSASQSEAAIGSVIQTNSLTPELVLRNPLHLPYMVMLYVLQASPFMSLAAVRAISVVFGLLGLVGFYYILKSWYSRRMALIGAALFVSSSWFLHTSRYADQASAYLLVPLLIAGVVALQRKARAPIVLIAVVILGMSMLYVPGLIWFLLPAVLLQRRVITKSFMLQPIWLRAILVIISILLLAPLAAMLVWPIREADTLHNGLALLGLPASFDSLRSILSNVVHTFGDIFVYSTAGPVYGPGHLPWLDVCTGILVAMGAVQFGRHFGLDRTKLLVIIGIIGLLLIAIGGPVPIVLLLPFVYLLAVEGLRWLLDMWLGVFPRNPFARGFGVSLAVVLVCMIGAYQTQKYFQAWAHAPETRQVFNKQL